MSRSVISNDKECIICGKSEALHRHHIYYGYANRKLSEKYGCWCYLCGYHHNLSNEGVHFDKHMDDWLKQYCQKTLESQGWSRKQFMDTFGRNYLDE